MPVHGEPLSCIHSGSPLPSSHLGPTWLYQEAPFAVLAHNTDVDPRYGCVRDYRGLRIAKSGRRFWIEDGVVWQLVDSRGVYRGQAAMFATWKEVPL